MASLSSLRISFAVRATSLFQFRHKDRNISAGRSSFPGREKIVDNDHRTIGTPGKPVRDRLQGFAIHIVREAEKKKRTAHRPAFPISCTGKTMDVGIDGQSIGITGDLPKIFFVLRLPRGVRQGLRNMSNRKYGRHDIPERDAFDGQDIFDGFPVRKGCLSPCLDKIRGFMKVCGYIDHCRRCPEAIPVKLLLLSANDIECRSHDVPEFRFRPVRLSDYFVKTLMKCFY